MTPPKPIVTYSLLAINITIFLVMTVMGANPSSPSAYTLYHFGGFLGPAITQDHEYWRFLTSMFLHAGFLHLLVNSISLKNVGPTLELLVGPKSFLALYLLSGLIATINVLLWSPNAVTVGASGAIFGIFSAQAGFLIKYKKLLPKSIYQSSIKSFIIVIVANLIIGFSIAGISNAGHIGGMIGGFLLIFIPLFTKRIDQQNSFRYF